MASFLGYMLEGFGASFVAIFLAIPAIVITRFAFKYPSSLGGAIKIFLTFSLLWGIKYTIEIILKVPLNDFKSDLVTLYFLGMPSIVYLLSFLLLRYLRRVFGYNPQEHQGHG